MWKYISLLGSAAALTNIPELFDEFKAKHGRDYENAEEELKRFKIFVSNMEAMEKMQKVDSEAKYSHLSPFADKAESEMNSFKGFKKNLSKKFDSIKPETLNTKGLPTNFDWRDEGCVNSPKDQAQCGSCWAFATVANVEGQNCVATGQLTSLSEQELVDCSTSDNGCNGGLPESAYEDMIANGMGLESESAYSYHAADGTCHAQKSKEKVFIDSWQPISRDEDQIKAAVKKYGPLAIGINASWMQLYSGGISNPPVCNPTELDHGVAIIGWGEENGTPYWTIRNSWGSSWGEKGYYRIIRNKGKCGLNTMVTTAIINPSKMYV